MRRMADLPMRWIAAGFGAIGAPAWNARGKFAAPRVMTCWPAIRTATASAAIYATARVGAVPIPAPIPAPVPAPAPTTASVNNTQPLIDLSAPEPVAELFNEKAEQSANLIENVQAEGLQAANEAKKNETKNEVKQRGGASKRSRKAKGKLLQFLKTLTRKIRKI